MSNLQHGSTQMAAVEQRAAADHFKQYERLLGQLAMKSLPRMKAFEPTMEFEDLKGFLTLVYVKCSKGFDGDRGLKFSTYLQNACYHELNRMIDKVAKERTVVSSSSVDVYFTDAGETPGVGTNDRWDAMADPGMQPDEAVEMKQHILRTVAGLSNEARMIVALLIAPTTGLKKFFLAERAAPVAGRVNGPEITVDVVCRYLRYPLPKVLALRNEFQAKCGVDLTKMNATRCG